MRLANEADAPSPALLVFPDRIESNLRAMITLAGDARRLRPHVKTHKLPQIVARQVALGITKCKAATIAEAEMAARAGATDIIIATQLVGPNPARLVALIEAFPSVAFATIADDASVVARLGTVARGARVVVEVLLDLDVGMHRTGIRPGPEALELYRTIAVTPGLKPGGLHANDGHLRQSDRGERSAAVSAEFSPVMAMREALRAEGLSVPRVVCGGTPTFPVHAGQVDVECSPGTCVLWDSGYGGKLPDLEFKPAAILLTRVLSRPGKDRLCLDLGHKAVASEMPHPRVTFPELPDAQAVTHSEEHLVIETRRAADFPVGSVLYAIPVHICPTVALHDRVHVVREGRWVEEWPVVARARRLTF